MGSSYRYGLVLLLFALPSVSFVAAQATTGTISGLVKDDSGAVLPGVTITLKNVETGIVRTVVSEDDGRYRASNLSLGRYEVQAELPGFQTSVRSGIELTLGREAVVDFTLKIGEISERLVITDEAPLVETTRSTIAGLVSTMQVESLPLNGRSFTELAELQPGVVQSVQSGVGTGQGFGRKVTISGSRPYETSYTLDGQDINDSWNFVGSAAGGVAGVDAVREFKVVTNPFSSEYGRMAGGQIQVVTKSGTNEFHGSVYEFHRNDNLDARNFFDPSRKPEFKRNQFGASAGGPIVRDRTFFFGNYEGLRETLGTTERSVVPDRNARTGLVPNAAGVLTNVGVHPAVKPFLDLYPLPNLREFGDGRGDFAWANNRITAQDYYLTRIDHNFGSFFGLGESNSFEARYTFDDSERIVAQNFLVDRSESTRAQYLSLVLNTVVSPRVVSRLQAAYNRSLFGVFNIAGERLKAAGNPDMLKLANTNLKGFSSISPGSGIANIGGDTLSPRLLILNLYQVKEDVAVELGRHSMKFGFNGEKFGNNWLHTFRAVGSFSFQNLSNFLRNVPTSFITVHPDSEFFRSFRQSLFGWYIQDDFRATSRITLNLGLRHEFITVPTEKWERIYILKNWDDPKADPLKDPVQGFFENPSLLNFAPRVGMAWDPFGTGKTAIRAGFGIFHSQLINNTWRFPAAQTAPLFRAAEIRSATTAVDFPNAFTTQRHLLGGSIAIQGVVPQPEQPTTMQYSLSVQHELIADTVMNVEYVGSRGYDIQRINDYNMRVPEKLADGRLFFGPTAQIFNPAAERLWINTFDGASFYHALRVGLSRRFAGNMGYQLSYTLSKSIDDGSNQQGSTDFSSESATNLRPAPPPFTPPARDQRGPSAFDVRHIFSSNFTYALPVGVGRRFAVSGVADKILGGWSVNGILRVAGGPPLQIDGSRASNVRTFSRWGDVISGPPNLVPGRSANPIRPQNPDQYFDPTAFALPDPGFFGNLGRHTAIGPGIANVDLSFFKATKIREKLSAQFRAEFFNVLNRPNFSAPGSAVFDATTFRIRPDAGRITNTSTTSRQIQFALRLIF